MKLSIGFQKVAGFYTDKTRFNEEYHQGEAAAGNANPKLGIKLM
jgi:hypothetical protein